MVTPTLSWQKTARTTAAKLALATAQSVPCITLALRSRCQLRTRHQNCCCCRCRRCRTNPKGAHDREGSSNTITKQNKHQRWPRDKTHWRGYEVGHCPRVAISNFIPRFSRTGAFPFFPHAPCVLSVDPPHEPVAGLAEMRTRSSSAAASI